MHKTIIALLLFVFLAGAAKGVSDTLQFHYGRSVFASFENEQWWDPAVSWKNKYRDYDAGDTREAYLFSRSLLVWKTDAWHLAQTIETLAWIMALLLAVRLGRKASGTFGAGYLTPFSSGWQMAAALLAASLAAFYGGFLLLYGWLLVR